MTDQGRARGARDDDPGWLLAQVAMGQEPPDTVIEGADVFDAVSGEFLSGRSVWIQGGRIARVPSADEPVHPAARIIDASGLTLVPGLIDGHTHLVRLFVPEFVRALLPTGVTSAVIEVMEYGVTLGARGLTPFLEALRDQPLRLYYTAPPLCGLTEAEELAPPSQEEMASLLADPLCLGLGETYWGNALLPGHQGRRVRQLVAQTLAAGKVVEGHTAGARGARLDAYVALGVSSCHEPISLEEALEVYGRGLLLMIRHGGIRRDLERLRPLFDLPLDFSRMALVTDSVDPVRLASWGHLDQVVREALGLGIPPALVYRMASTNVAEHFRIADRLGYIAPGRWADLVAVPSPAEFQPVMVMAGGEVVYDRGEVLASPRPCPVADEFLRTVGVDPVAALRMTGPPPAPPGGRPVRVVEMVTSLVTREAVLSPDEARRADLCPVLALERSRGQEGFWGFVKDLGLREGAYATTMSWDSPALLVAGRDEVSVRTALGRLVENGGGAVFARGSDVTAEYAAPICGVSTSAPAAQVRADLERVNAELVAAGVRWEDPHLAVETLTTPAIPHLRMSHRGYVRLKDRALLSREV